MPIIRKIPVHWWVIISAWGSRFISIATQLLSIRIIIELIDEKHYAVFVLLSALMNWIIYLLDMGISNHLQNAISTRRANKESYADLIFVSVYTLSAIGIFWIIFYFLTASLLSDLYLKEYLLLLQGKASQLLIITEMLFLGAGLGYTIQRIWYAENKGWKANIIQAIGWVGGLPCIYIAYTWFRTHDLLTILVAYYLPLSLLGWFSYGLTLWHAIKTGYKTTLKRSIQLIKDSSGFWILTLLMALSLQIDYFIISQTLDQRITIQYFLVIKIYTVVNFAFSAILSAIWPVCAEAAASNEWYKLRQFSKRYMKLGIGFALCCIIMFLLCKDIAVQILSPGKDLTLPVTMIILLGITQILRIWSDTYSTLLLSLNQHRNLWVIYAVQACFSVIFQWFGAVHFGYIGMITGLILSLLLTSTWSIPYHFYRYLRLKENMA